MEFDNRSLAAAAAVATLLCTAARFLLRSMHPAMPGLTQWAWAAALGVPALALYAAHGKVPDWMTVLLPQILLVSGFLLAYGGFRRFLDRPHLGVKLWLLLGAAFLLPLLGAHLTGAQTVRSIAGSLAIATVTALLARALLAWAPPGRTAVRATAGVYGLTSLFFLGRAAAIAASSQPDLVLHSDGFSSVALLWSLGLILATTLGMALMTGERLQDELNHQASRDPLTGALNRRAFALLAPKTLARCQRNGEALAVLVMDLDHFKQINDRHGHAMGDTYLCRFVEIAEQTLRAEDVVCRFGGEEFVALMPGATLSQALAAADRLRAAFAAQMLAAPDLPFSATVSIGVGALTPDESIEDLLDRADQALYAAKRNGRNRCEVAPHGRLPEPAGLDL